MADIPLVFGLVFATGDGLVVGALLGVGSLWALRRVSAVNLTQLGLAASVAVAILRTVAGPSWSRSSWSGAPGGLAAGWARSSWSCECSKAASGEVDPARSLEPVVVVEPMGLLTAAARTAR